MIRGSLCLLAVFLLTLAAPRPLQASILYGTDGTGGSLSTLYTVDPNTAATTAIGPVGFSVTGIDFDPTSGILYGVTSNPLQTSVTLLTINTATGGGTAIATVATTQRIPDIAFDAAGNLYGWGRTADDPVTINKVTGAIAVVGDSGLSTPIAGLAFDQNDVLYLESAGTLRTIDSVTGQVIATIGSDSNNQIGSGMDFDETNSLFALDRTGQLVSVDTSTGAATVIGSFDDFRMESLAFSVDVDGVNAVPEPVSVAVWGALVGLVFGFCALRRVRK
jgi:hypothetical protein